MQVKIAILVLVLFCALLGAFGQIFFKLASKDVSMNVMDWLKNYKFFIGAILYALSAVLFVVALKYGDLSLLYPIIATSYIWVSLFSNVFLREEFPLFKWLGIILIIAGIIIIVR